MFQPFPDFSGALHKVREQVVQLRLVPGVLDPDVLLPDLQGDRQVGAVDVFLPVLHLERRMYASNRSMKRFRSGSTTSTRQVHHLRARDDSDRCALRTLVMMLLISSLWSMSKISSEVSSIRIFS